MEINGFNNYNSSQFLGFRSGVAELSVLLGYHSSLLGNWFQTFRDRFILLFSCVKNPLKMRLVRFSKRREPVIQSRGVVPYDNGYLN